MGRHARFSRVRDFLALETNIVVLSLSIFLVGVGENLWSEFIPLYLTAFGASVALLGAFGTLKEILETFYQYPGGYITDRIGRKPALILFGLVGVLGYIIYAGASHWIMVFAGTVFVMGAALSHPAMFALIGDTLPPEKRTMGFSVQSTIKRLPFLFAPVIGGYVIDSIDVVPGVRATLAFTIVVAALALVMQKRYYTETLAVSERRPTKVSLAGIVRDAVSGWRQMDKNLKHLLLADSIVRFADRMTKVLVVIYLMREIGVSAKYFGFLVSVRYAVSILSYLPAARIADRWRRLPVVATTFFFMALFPVSLLALGKTSVLWVAFVILGLREVGEPARKALIVDMTPKARRGEFVGIYNGLRGIVMMIAPLIGARIYLASTTTLFVAASVVGFLALALLVATVREPSNPTVAIDQL